MKQPRPCTLWGQTFDANEFVEIRTRLEDSRHPGGLYSVQVSWYEQSKTGLNGKHLISSAGSYSGALYCQNQTMYAITLAQNPLLDVDHALESAYEFQEHLLYNTDVGQANIHLQSGEYYMTLINGKTYPLSYVNWFYPCNEYGQPIQQGEKEAVVKAYKKAGE